MSYTRGPWFAINYAGWINLQTKKEYEYSSNILDSEHYENAEENGKLAAAAPELLEICIEFCERVERGEVKSSKTYAKMKEVIKKAIE